jgi:hypothetical protein
VKALTRRLGHLGRDEYDTLRPAAALIDSLQTHVRPFLESPLRWEPAHGATDEMMNFAIDKIAQEVYRRLHEWVGQRMVRDRIIKWQEAYAIAASARHATAAATSSSFTARPRPFRDRSPIPRATSCSARSAS